ncbi:MAG: histidinol-phosphate transaminase [Eubacterium sp.]|nr:histidinol-phosphate transaminase [Eubacterium sp.]
MNYLWEKNIRKIEPYVPGEQSKEKNIVKINANENPYPPSPKAIQAIKDFSADKLRFYPDANAYPLKKALADYYGVETNNIFVGNGSDDVIALCFQTFFCSDKSIAFPDITYSFYPVWCRLFNIPFKTYKLDENFRIIPEDYKEENGGVILPNPNAPTSIGEGLDFVRKLLEYNQDGIVIIDEAYVDFGGVSCTELIKEYSNLVVTGTFSKSRSLASLRIGFAVANEELISYLEAVKNSYNSYTVDSLSIAAGAASVKDDEYFKETVGKVIKTRKRVKKELEKLGFEVLPSSSNFIMITHKDYEMKKLFEYLKTKNIFIRYFSLPRIDKYVRVTIGTDEEMDIFLNEVKEFLK